jgi:hypothetical protein
MQLFSINISSPYVWVLPHLQWCLLS